MSANDPTEERPPSDEAVSKPNEAISESPTADEPRAASPEWQTELGLPLRPIAQAPRWPHPNFGWSLLWCLLFVIVTQGPGILVASVIILAWILMAPEQFPEATTTNLAVIMVSKPVSVALGVAFFITEFLVISFSLLIIRLVVGRDWTRHLALRRPSAAHTFLALASLPALWLMGNVAYDILHNMLHVPSLSDLGAGGMEAAMKVASTWPWSFAVLVIGVGAGVGEELWCRGFLGRGLVGNYGVVFGVLATSFCFGLIHLDPCQGTMAMIMGLWLHFVYLTTRSLWLPMLLHFLNNSLSVLLPRYPGLETIEVTPADIPALVYLSAFALLGVAAYALYQSRARLTSQTPEQPLLWRPAWPGVEYPPADSGARVTHPAPSPRASSLAAGSFFLFVAACVLWIQTILRTLESRG